MKVCIIGGGGRVGAGAAFALQGGGVVSEIQLLDARMDAALGEALDLLHGAAFAADQRIYSGDYGRAADSDLFLIAAGFRRSPNESRLALVQRNVALFIEILAGIQSAGFRRDALFVVVSNPVDILTHIAAVQLGLPWQQVLGLGTLLDTARFSSLIADELKLAATQVQALVLGEHGDSMVPIWSSATVNGLPLTAWPECTPSWQTALAERTRGSGAEIIARKGGAGWAVATVLRELVHAIALNQRRLLPVSTLQQGAFGIRDVCLSVPTVVGRRGAVQHVELKLWPKELNALHNAARVLQAALGNLRSGRP